MEWHQAYIYLGKLRQIEQFLIELAANEEVLGIFGLRRALVLPGYENALEAMKSFSEDFLRLKRAVMRIDPTIASEINVLDSGSDLVDQIALISLRLRMAESEKPTASSRRILLRYMSIFPFMIRGRADKIFGDEPVSLQKTIIGLGRLISMTKASVELIEKNQEAEAALVSSGINKDRVIELIDAALEQVRNSRYLTQIERARLVAGLESAKREASFAKPSWHFVIGALVIIASLTSGIADAPLATKNIRDAIEHILGENIDSATRKLIAPPEDVDPGRSVDDDTIPV